MKGQTRRSNLKRRPGAGRLAGTIGLLLALALVALTPAYAAGQDLPELPEHFRNRNIIRPLNDRVGCSPQLAVDAVEGAGFKGDQVNPEGKTQPPAGYRSVYATCFFHWKPRGAGLWRTASQYPLRTASSSNPSL